MKRAAITVLLVLLCGGPALRADEASSKDLENPRNVVFSSQIIEYVSATPAMKVGEVGSTGVWPAGTAVNWSVHALDPRAAASAGAIFYGRTTFSVDGKALKTVSEGPRGARAHPRLGKPMNQSHATWVAQPGRHQVSLAWEDSNDTCVVESDALRVLLWVEGRTKDAGDLRFGSFTRRFRKSLEDLHALFSASSWPLAPEGVVDRFRIETVGWFIGADGRKAQPKGPDSSWDVAVVCEEGGPLAGFSLPEYVIGHNFTGPEDHHGLWSSWGEQALWHELMHFRGVQDFYIYEVPDGGLPGRWKGVLPLPKRYAQDLMASPYQKPVLGEYAAVVANSKKGIARVGACEDTDNKYGHMWNWLPGRIDLALVKDKVALAGATVRWWRSRAVADVKAAKDPRQQGVGADRAPDGEATTNEKGQVQISGDYLGRLRPREDRSLWLLVEVESANEKRFEILYGLDLNLSYARGDKYASAPVLEWERLLTANGTVPTDR